MKSILGLGSLLVNTSDLERLDAEVEDRKRERRITTLKYSVPGVVVTASALYALAVVVDYATFQSICHDLGGTHLPFLQHIVLVLVLLFTGVAAVVTYAIRHFKDNFGVNAEIRRIFALFFIVIPVGVPLMFFARSEETALLTIYVLGSLFNNGIFIISGFIPLRQQWRLERRVAACNFGDAQKIEDVLFDDAAALVSFKEFLAREFCEELLEFYGAPINAFVFLHFSVAFGG